MIPLRDENPTETFPFITLLFIGVNIASFFYQLSLGHEQERFIMEMGVIPLAFTREGFSAHSATLITSMFLHGGFLHIIGNMLYLWIFGNNVEDNMGHLRFIFFYFICGIAASMAHILSAPKSALPAIGASGAISGVLGAYLVLFPRARVLTLVPLFFFWRIIELPAIFFLGVWILFQGISGLSSAGVPDQGGGVAWFAHMGGFAAGVILIFLFRKKKRWRW